MDFWGKRLKELRISRRLTQDELATSANISLEYVGKIERGEVSNIGTEIAESLAKAVGVKPQYLLYGEGADSADIGFCNLRDLPIALPGGKEIRELNEEERRLVAYFNAIPTTAVKVRRNILEIAESFANTFKKIAKK